MDHGIALTIDGFFQQLKYIDKYLKILKTNTATVIPAPARPFEAEAINHTTAYKL